MLMILMKFSFVPQTFFRIFTFLSHTEYVKRESIVIAWVKKKNSLLLTNVHDLYVLEDKTSQKKCPSVCLSVRMYVRTWTLHVDTITFEGVSGSKQNLVGVYWCVCRSGIEIQSNIIILILILILNRILIFTRTLRCVHKNKNQSWWIPLVYKE